MSTRANVVIVKDGFKSVCLYHHYDGYPSGLGSKLTSYIEDILVDEKKDSIMESTDSLSEWFTSQDKFFEKDGYWIHRDIEYLYVINLDDNSIRCYDAWCWTSENFNEGIRKCNLPLVYQYCIKK